MHQAPPSRLETGIKAQESGVGFWELSAKVGVASLVALAVENLPAMRETWVRALGPADPLEKGKLPTPVFLPGEFQGQRSLADYSPWGLQESNTTA